MNFVGNTRWSLGDNFGEHMPQGFFSCTGLWGRYVRYVSISCAVRVRRQIFFEDIIEIVRKEVVFVLEMEF